MRWLTALLVVPAILLAVGLTRSAQPDASPVLPGLQQPGAGGAQASSPSTAHSRSVAAPARQRSAPPAQRHAAAGRLQLQAEGSASARLRLRSVIHPDLSRVTFTSTGRYAGVWILDAHGTVVGNALHLTGPGHRPYTSSPDALPAGSYTVYVVGQGHVVATIPLRPSEQGLSLTATRATTASYAETRHTMQRLESTSAVRLHVPSAPAAMGYGGGFVDTPAHGAATVDVCLTRRDADCRHHVDPEYAQDTQLAERGYYGSSFAMPPYLVHEGRDVLVTVDTHSTGATAITAWSFTVRLT